MNNFILQKSTLNLETAVQGDKGMQDFKSESFVIVGDHSQLVKAPTITSDYGLKDCVNLSPSTAVSGLNGSLTIPPSKSQTMRAILFGALAQGKSVVHNYLQSPDTDAMIHACRLFGASITVEPNRITMIGTGGIVKSTDEIILETAVQGDKVMQDFKSESFVMVGDHSQLVKASTITSDYGLKDCVNLLPSTTVSRIIHAGNSGIVLRFLSALSALSDHFIVLSGDQSICTNRPMDPLLHGLKQLGVQATSARNNGYAPVIIKGPLKPGKAIIDGQDSQHVSALLIASAFVSGSTELLIRNPGEKPWVALTLSWFDKLGISYENYNFERYIVNGGQSYEGFEYYTPGDLSSLAFPVVAALATRSSLVIHNVDMNDCQGDKKLIAILQEMGAPIDINISSKTLYVHKRTTALHGRTVDINDYIDAIAILAVVGCMAEGITRITNAAIARTKECDRIHCLCLELTKMGAKIEENKDGLTIYQSNLVGATVKSHNDHRLAMALSVAALAAEGESKVEGVNCIDKTYPNFLKQFQSLGANIRSSV